MKGEQLPPTEILKPKEEKAIKVKTFSRSRNFSVPKRSIATVEPKVPLSLAQSIPENVKVVDEASIPSVPRQIEVLPVLATDTYSVDELINNSSVEFPVRKELALEAIKLPDALNDDFKNSTSLLIHENDELDGSENEIGEKKDYWVGNQKQEDTDWVDNLFQARMSEVEASEAEPEEVEAPTAEEVIVADIGERLEVSEEVVEQVETLVAQMPEEVGERLAEFIADEENEPEVVAATEELVVRIAQVADRLHELAMTEQLEGPEAEQIQEVLREWYAELLTTLELPVDEEVLAAFIELVCSEAYEAKSQTDEEESLETQFDIFKERKPGLAFDLSAIMGGVTRIEHRLEHEIARLMVRRSTAAVAA